MICESGLSVYMAGPVIGVLCLPDTCASEVHPVFNLVAHYGYLLPNMYLFIADIKILHSHYPRITFVKLFKYPLYS